MNRNDPFFRAYVEAALWSSTDDDGEPLDGLYTADDIHPDTLARMAEDCADFCTSFGERFQGREAQAGHDFWLTRNRHGAGFWDGDWERETGRFLTEMSHPYGSFDLYIGDDGLIHGQ